MEKNLKTDWNRAEDEDVEMDVDIKIREWFLFFFFLFPPIVRSKEEMWYIEGEYYNGERI